MIKVKVQRRNRVCQGDIFKDIEYIEYVEESEGIVELSKIIFPYIIVLSQDCDLQYDYIFRWSEKRKNTNDDKLLMSVLVAPMYIAEHVYKGEHLSEIKLQMESITKKRTPGQNLRNNETPRYHYLEFPSNIQLSPSVIDFKHYFTVNIMYLRSMVKNNFICKVSELYREDISQRFSNYLSRIGLPNG